VRFCFDVDEIKSVGIKEWSDTFFWPVTFEEYKNLYNKIWDSFEYVKGMGDESVNDIVESCCKLANHYALVAHQKMVSDRIKDRRFTYDEDNVLSRNLSKIKDFWSVSEENSENALKNFLRSFKHSIMSNLSLGIYPSGGLVNSIGSFCDLKRAYLIRNKLFMIYKHPQAIIGSLNNDNYRGRYGNEIKTIVDTLIERLMLNLENMGISLPNDVIKEFKSIALSNFIMFSALHEQLKNNMAQWKRRVILAGGIGNPVHRAILLANTRTGGHSIGVSHGNYVGLHRYPLYHRQELSPVNEFLVPTEGAKITLQSAIRENEMLRGVKTQITSVQDDSFKKHWESNKTKPLPSGIKKIMYLGFPFMDYRDFEFPECFAPIQIDFELRVLSLLKSRYYVIYKAHPDRLTESDGGRIWSDLADRIETRRFEEVYEDADAYIFGSTGTTTFCFTFPTKKRIIFFDTGHRIFEEEAKRLMLKRAIAVSAWFDERNRLQFNPDELLEALERKPEEPNTEFIERNMFP
jgi:hypothetical protein